MAKPRVDAKTRDEDAPITSWGFGFLPQETEAQIQSRHAFYMFEFRVRKCILFRTHSCKHCKPFSCRYAHYENQTRRIPKLVGDAWNYDVQLCSANSLLECPQGLKCGLSHRLQKENIYHPLVYKTKVCEHSLISCGPPLSGSPYTSTQAADFFPPTSQEWFQCSEFGIHCAKAHGSKDLRVVPGSEGDESESSSPSPAAATTCSSAASSPALQPLSSSVPRASSFNSLNRISSSSSLARVGSSSSLSRVGSSSSIATSSPLSAATLSNRSNTRSSPLVLRPSTKDEDEEDSNEKKTDESGSDGGSKSEDNCESKSASRSISATKPGSSNEGRNEIMGRDSFNEKHNTHHKNFLVFHKAESARRNSITDANGHSSRSLTSSASAPALFSSKSRSGSSSSLAILDAPHLEHSHSPHFPPFHEGSSRLKASSASFFASSRAATSSPTVRGELVMHTPPNLELEGGPDHSGGENIHHSSSSHSLHSLRRVDSTHSLRKSDSTQSLHRVGSTQSLRRVDSAAELDPAAGNCVGWLNSHNGEPPQDSIAHSHQIYLDSFRVRMCVDFLSNKCNFNSRTCFHAHHQRNRRRRPVLSNGRFNYVSTRCPTLERERTCPSGASCHYAHTAEEVVYHPSKYKTHMCAYALGRDQACSEYGMHCAKAHGPDDKRDPVLSEDEVSRNEEHAHFMFEYKTKPCEGYSWDCNNRQYHSVKERRRLLVNIRYLPEPCPNVFVGQKWGSPNVHCRDESGNRIDPVTCGEDEEWRCFLAHTPNEIAYHPLVYKTVACEAFDRNHVCEGRFCPSSHGASDRRSQHTAREWKTQIISRAAFEASSHRLSRTGSYALLPRSGSGASSAIPRNASYPSLKSSLSTAPAPFVSSHADQLYSSPSPSPSFTSPRRIGTRTMDEEGTRKRSDSGAGLRRIPSQEQVDSGHMQSRPPAGSLANPYPSADHESTPGCFAPFSFGLGLSGAFENSLWVRPRGEDIWRPPDKAVPEPFTVRPTNVDNETGGPWCSCATFKTKLSCKHVAPVMSVPSPQSHSQSSSDSPRSSTLTFSSLAIPILSSCSSQAPPSPSFSSTSAPSAAYSAFSPPPATPPQSIPVIEPGARCSCARFLEVGICKHISRVPPTASPPKSSSIVDSATAAAAQLSWRAEELMDHSHRKLSGYMGSLGASIEEADREWFRKPKSNPNISSTTPIRTSNLATIHTSEALQYSSRESDSSNQKSSDPFGAPPAYSSSMDSSLSTASSVGGGGNSSISTLASSSNHSGSSRDLKKTSELIAEAKMKGLGGGGPPLIRTSSPSIEPLSGANSPSASSASLLRKSLSKLPALRLPDVKSLFPTWPPPRTAPLQQQQQAHLTASSPPSFFDSSEAVLEEELEPAGLGDSEPPSPSQPQPQGAAWASTPLDFSSNQSSPSSSQSAFESPTEPPSQIRFSKSTSVSSSVNSSPSIATVTIHNPLSKELECKFPLLFPSLSSPHILVNPVSLQCCGLCMCRLCVASAASAASPSLVCTCGTPITAPVLKRALEAPSNQALMAILSMFAAQQLSQQ